MRNWTAEKPVIPDYWVTLTDFGGIGDGLCSNTQAFASGIAALSEAGGGHLLVPAGIWLTGPIELKSGIDLHLEEGALVLFDKNKEEYPLYIADYEGVKCIRAKSPIGAEEAHDISITGKGVIDGNGHLWRMAKQFKFTPREWEARKKSSPDTVIDTKEGEVWFPTKSAFDGAMRQEADLETVGAVRALEEAAPYYDYYRPCMVNLVGCDRVLLEGVTFRNSPAWNVHPLFCRNLTIRHAIIHNEAYAQNGDGLDVESCSQVEIHDTVFDVGDDAICMKSGKNGEARKIAVPTEKVWIHDCKVLRGHGGFVIGSEMSRGVRDVEVENCTFMGTDIGLRFKSALGRGGVVENIRIKGIQMLRIPGEAIVFTMGYTMRKLDGTTPYEGVKVSKEDVPEFRNFEISHINVLEAKTGLKIEGLDEMPVHDIHLEQISIGCEAAAVLHNAENISLKDVCFVQTGTGKRIEISDETQIETGFDFT